MDVDSRLDKAFLKAPRLPLNEKSRYVLMSDCHRGCGTSNDNFLKNQNLFYAALQYYYNEKFTYIELGDGDELWENRSIRQIMEVHSDVFSLMSRFYLESRLHMIYGNHDMVKRSENYAKEHCSSYFCSDRQDWIPLFPGIRFHQGIILANEDSGPDVYLAHGHQADFFNSSLWRLSRFLVRYVWKPLEHMGFLDPTSAAKNNTKKEALQQRLLSWTQKRSCILVTGHTHRPSLDENGKMPCLNTGSCVHPGGITAIELIGGEFALVKWTYCVRSDYTVYVCREMLAGPVTFRDFPLEMQKLP